MKPSPVSDPVIRTYAQNGLLVDTNLLLLYLVGEYDTEYVQAFKRTQMYTVEDFDLVAWCIDQSPRIVTTPHILSELSNLSLGSKGKPGIKGKRVHAYCAVLVHALQRALEIHIEKDVLLGDPWLARIGFTDLSILEAWRRHRYAVLTADSELAKLLASERCPVATLERLRELPPSQRRLYGMPSGAKDR